MSRAIAAAATLALEFVIFATALFLAVAAEAWVVPVLGLPRGVAAVYVALGVSFFAAGFVRFPWARHGWQVGVAALAVALVVLGVLVWNYQAGIIRNNPRAWLVRLEYLWSGGNLVRGVIGVVGALSGFLCADRLTRKLGRHAGRPSHEHRAVEQ